MTAIIPYLVPVASLSGLLAGLSVVLIIAEKLLVNYGICKIDINDGEQTIEVEGGQTLMSALVDAGIKIQAACGGKGSCGYCKTTVVSGGGDVLPTETSFLSRQEKRSNVRLSCQVKIRNDMKVKLIDFLETVRKMVKAGTFNADLKWHWRVGAQAAGESVSEAPAAPLPEFTDEDRAFLKAELDPMKGEKGSLIAALQAINTHFRYLPAEALEHTSKILDVPLSRVYGLATFYNSFSLTPKGKKTVKVCLGTACHVKGATRILERLERELGIKEGGTTPDLAFSLEGVRCLGCCGLAPVLTFDDAVHGKVKAGAVPKLLKAEREAVATN